jgi:hypothetical protein
VFLTAKIVPTGGRVGGLGGWVFSANRKTEKNFSKCLIFNGLMFFGSLFGGFSVAEKPLIFNALPTSRKRLSLNAFTHLYGAGGWVKGRVLSKG